VHDVNAKGFYFKNMTKTKQDRYVSKIDVEQIKDNVGFYFYLYH